MRVIRSVKEMFAVSQRNKLQGKTIGFVPTMGALHPGHLILIRRARRQNDLVVVSIFVNPAQFSPREDFKKYPRPFAQDAKLCRQEKVDIIFYPAPGEMYPPNYKTYVTVEDLSTCLCGKFRPGHFRGVATIVSKLFNIVMPDVAYFGQKDAQQAIIIQRMVKDLNMPVRIKVMPTMRENDGLAMSSRNVYLSKSQRKEAAVLYQALIKAKKMVHAGSRNASEIIRQMKQLIGRHREARVQYISIVEPKGLRPQAKIRGRVLVALAVFFGKTRLIDNIVIN